MNGAALRERDAHGQPVHDDSFLILFNAHVDTVSFDLPAAMWGSRWARVFDTWLERPFEEGGSPLGPRARIDRPGLSVLLLRREPRTHVHRRPASRRTPGHRPTRHGALFEE